MSDKPEILQGEYFFLPQEHIVFGAGSLAHLADEVRRVGGQRAFLITGNSLATQSDVVQRVEQALGSLHVGTFSAIRQHSPKGDVAQATEQARTLHADVLISVGGGSPIDATKAVAMALSPNQKNFLPHIAIPTTLSAAEFSHLVGVTDEEAKRKSGFAHVQLAPRSVILDATLTLPTPMQLWLSTGIRSLDHAVESLYAPGMHPINDVLALEAIRKLFEYLPEVKAQPDNLNARTELQLASWMSFFGEVNTLMGLSHNLGRRIGASYDVPHGITSCIILPHVMQAFALIHSQLLARIANVLGLHYHDDTSAALAAADAAYGLIGELGLPQHLHDVGINETQLVEIAETTPCRELTTEEVEKLLHTML